MSEETLLKFPCDFPIKAMGRAGEAFPGIVIDIVRRHAPNLDENRVRIRASSKGRYQSVTVTIRAESKSQLDNIYQALTDHDQVMMAL
jgi:putative lipoic acid-binding regulatory protein